MSRSQVLRAGNLLSACVLVIAATAPGCDGAPSQNDAPTPPSIGAQASQMTMVRFAKGADGKLSEVQRKTIGMDEFRELLAQKRRMAEAARRGVTPIFTGTCDLEQHPAGCPICSEGDVWFFDGIWVGGTRMGCFAGPDVDDLTTASAKVSANDEIDPWAWTVASVMPGAYDGYLEGSGSTPSYTFSAWGDPFNVAHGYPYSYSYLWQF